MEGWREIMEGESIIEIEARYKRERILRSPAARKTKLLGLSEEDKLIELACDKGEAEAKDVDFTETIDFESQNMVENEPEYYSPAQGKFGIIKATKSDLE